MDPEAQAYLNKKLTNARKAFGNKVNLIPWKSLNNRHKEKRCFIIGSSAAVDDIDLRPLQGEITFGMNRSVNLFIPTYFVAIDGVCLMEPGVLQRAAETDVMFLEVSNCWDCLLKAAKRYGQMVGRDKVFFYFADLTSSGIKTHPLTRLTSDVAYMCNGGSVLFPTLQWAYIMGCDPIYLLGVNFRPYKGKSHWYDKGLVGSYFHYPGAEWVMREMAQIARAQGRTIACATPESWFVEKGILPEVKYDGLFPAGGVK